MFAFGGAGFRSPPSPKGPLGAVGFDRAASFAPVHPVEKRIRSEGQADPTGAREWSRCRFRTTGGEKEVMADVWDTA